MKAASLVLLALLAGGVATQATDISVLDATPEFWKFRAKAQGKPDAERARQFMDVVVVRHPELYTADVLNKNALSGPARDQDAATIVTRFLRGVAPFVARMKEVSGSIHQDFQAYARDFTTTFPDFRPTTRVVFMVSLFGFDGGTRMVAGKTNLLFGIDGIARFHPPGESLKVFFDHDLFHQYHDQVAPELGDEDAPLWQQMWEEGLATYLSQRMNPGATEAQALMSPTLGEVAQPMLATLAPELRKNAESLDRDEYAAFFFGQNSRPDLPPRSGYYVGYRVAQILGAGRTPQQLALLQGAELKAGVICRRSISRPRNQAR